MADDDISITYEKLFDLTRKEKGNEELQKLDDDFYNNLTGYLNDKKSILQSSKTDSTMFSKPEKEITRKQMENIKKLINELYMRREQKIMNLAIMKSRTNSGLIDTGAMLEEEKILFNNMVSILEEYKKEVLFNILRGNKPNKPSKIDKNGSSEESTQQGEEKQESMKVEFVHDVPKFVGKEMETYGPYTQGNVIELPSQIANILINKGRAKKAE